MAKKKAKRKAAKKSSKKVTKKKAKKKAAKKKTVKKPEPEVELADVEVSEDVESVTDSTGSTATIYVNCICCKAVVVSDDLFFCKGCSFQGCAKCIPSGRCPTCGWKEK